MILAEQHIRILRQLKQKRRLTKNQLTKIIHPSATFGRDTITAKARVSRFVDELELANMVECVEPITQKWAVTEDGLKVIEANISIDPDDPEQISILGKATQLTDPPTLHGTHNGGRRLQIGTYIIDTAYMMPPLPFHDADWLAVLADKMRPDVPEIYEYYGWGETEEAAVENLFRSL